MAIDKLQNEIRKMKNPSMVAFSMNRTCVPPAYLEAASDFCGAYCQYAKNLLKALKDLVPAVRFSFGSFALHGPEGLYALKELLSYAREQKYYILLDMPELHSVQETELASGMLFGEESLWECDGLLLSCYMGSDGIKPFADQLKDSKKDLFVVLRTGNRSASEIQDLLTGSRLVYTVAADMAKRLGEAFVTKCGYSRIAGVGAANAADSLRALRGKCANLFLLVDGFEYPGANAKVCSLAFDKLGHGAIVCAESYVTAAWKEESAGNTDPVDVAVQAAERMKKNLTRYVTVL